jgi:hypothetical protein
MHCGVVDAANLLWCKSLVNPVPAMCQRLQTAAGAWVAAPDTVLTSSDLLPHVLLLLLLLLLLYLLLQAR